MTTIVIRIVSPRRRLSVTNLSLENNLPTFQPNAPVVIRVKDFCFTLTTAGVFSRNVELVTDNLLVHLCRSQLRSHFTFLLFC